MNGFFLIAIFLIPVNLLSPNQTETAEWKLIDSGEGVKTYERWIKVNSDLTVREQKGIIETTASVDNVMKFLQHAPNFKLWMSAVDESYVIKKTDNNNWYTYTLFDLPWPIGDRDLVAHYKLHKINDAHYVVSLKSIDDLVPKKQNVTRFLKYYGSWEIKSLGKNKTEITHIARADEPPAFPRYLQDPVIRSSFSRSLRNLKGLLDK